MAWESTLRVGSFGTLRVSTTAEVRESSATAQPRLWAGFMVSAGDASSSVPRRGARSKTKRWRCYTSDASIRACFGVFLYVGGRWAAKSSGHS
ncbi:hypothetical protein CJJ09_003034 [Candidozyma auris]|nr:hypothetical protein CJJ09_003034 [[Candida] auris]